MNILIVEDDKHKSSEVIEYIVSKGISRQSITLTESIADTVTFLSHNTPDKIVLDMSLPSHTSGSSIPLTNGGMEVLLELRYAGILDLPVLILTQFPQAEVNSQLFPLDIAANEIMKAYSMTNISVSDFESESKRGDLPKWKSFLDDFLGNL